MQASKTSTKNNLFIAVNFDLEVTDLRRVGKLFFMHGKNEQLNCNLVV